MKGGIMYLKNIKGLEKFTIDNKTPLYKQICKIYTFNDSNYIDYEWIEKQMNYINKLSDKDKHIIRTYTIYADKLVNKYIRKSLKNIDIDIILDITTRLKENPFKYHHYDKTGNYNIDDIYKTNIIEYIEQYIKDFTKIIEESPRLTKPIKVFRGLTNGQYIVNGIEQNIHNNQVFKNKDFISTSIYLESAANFMEGECCLLELNLDVSTPCLFTAHISRCGTEYEITLAPNTIMKYVRCNMKKMLNSPEYYESFNTFIQPSKYDTPLGRVCEFIVYSS